MAQLSLDRKDKEVESCEGFLGVCKLRQPGGHRKGSETGDIISYVKTKTEIVSNL